MTPIRLSAPLLLALLVPGCGDPLIGTWVTHAYPGGTLPEDVSTYEEDLTFGSNMSFAVSISLGISTGASVYPGCKQTCAYSTLRWATSSAGGTTTLTVSGTAQVNASRTGCTSSSDDMSETPATPADCPPGMPGGAYKYTVDDDTLTTTASSGTVETYTLSDD